MKIAKKHAKKIASLINSLQVAESFCCKYQGVDIAKFNLWKASECEATIELADTYGIILPCLDTQREWLASRR